MTKEKKAPIIRLVDSGQVEKVERIMLPSLMLTWITGGGIPKRRITVLSGFEHSGKTTVSLLAAIECAKRDELVIYADVEGTYDVDWVEKLGLPKEKRKYIKLWYPETIEEFFDSSLVILKEHKPALLVLDSIHFLPTNEEFEKDTGGSAMGRHIAPINSGLRKLSNDLRDGEADTAVVIINKIYNNIGNMYEPLVDWGGGYLRMAASIRLWMRRAKKVTEKEEKDSELSKDINFAEIFVENKKNKTAQPFRKGDLVLNLKQGGVDAFNEMRVFGIKYGVLRDKNGDRFKSTKFGNSSVYFEGEKVSEKAGQAGFAQRLADDAEFRINLYTKIYQAILEDAETEDKNLSELDEAEIIGGIQDDEQEVDE